jgi:hypothetical protein
VEWIVPEVIISNYNPKKHLLHLLPYALPIKAIQENIKLTTIISVSANLFGFEYGKFQENDGVIIVENGIEYHRKLDIKEGVWVYSGIKAKFPTLQLRRDFVKLAEPIPTINNIIKDGTVFKTSEYSGTVYDIKKDGNIMVQMFNGNLYYIESRFLTKSA